jgi:uncharacterized repeat protein (TIGR04076 family)
MRVYGAMIMYKVRCKLVKFEGDYQTFPCHFGYEIGEEIYYDGVKFSGRICPHLLLGMIPVVHGVHLLGDKYSENVAFRYRGRDARDPSMAKYDGVGFRPLKNISEESRKKSEAVVQLASGTQKAKGAHFTCTDTRTLAHFSCEPVDLSDSEFCQPFYRRAIAILEKIEAEPGIRIDAIRAKFTPFELEDISPPLTPVLTDVLLEALADQKYIEIQDSQARATGRQPPSRPKIG